MKTKEQILQEKFVMFINTITISPTNTYYFDDKVFDVFENDEDLPILSKKIHHFVELINTLSDSEMLEFKKREFETDVWYIL